jgi:hypothetical protein
MKMLSRVSLTSLHEEQRWRMLPHPCLCLPVEKKNPIYILVVEVTVRDLFSNAMS